MRKIGKYQTILLTSLFIGMLAFPSILSAEAAEAVKLSGDAQFHTLLKDATVRQIHAAATQVMFTQLSLTRKKSEDCNCTSNKADFLTGRIEAASADGVTFVVRVHYLSETTCGLWIHAYQDSEVPADLKKYCQMIYDRTAEQLEKIQAQQTLPEPDHIEPMEFSADYNLSIEAIYKVMSETANRTGVGHGTSRRNRYAVEGNYTSGQTRFNYKAYLAGHNKLKFRFWKSGTSREEIDGQRYIYETICKEFTRQLERQIKLQKTQ